MGPKADKPLPAAMLIPTLFRLNFLKNVHAQTFTMLSRCRFEQVKLCVCQRVLCVCTCERGSVSATVHLTAKREGVGGHPLSPSFFKSSSETGSLENGP